MAPLKNLLAIIICLLLCVLVLCFVWGVLKDKSFQHQCIKMLIQFLTERGYDQPISLKLLTRPTGRDFYNIAEFLVKCIDPRFTFKVR